MLTDFFCVTSFAQHSFRIVFIMELQIGIREDTQIELAINLLDILPDEEIADRIKLPLETVQQLRKDNS